MSAGCPQHMTMVSPFSAEAITKPMDPRDGLAPPSNAIAIVRLMMGYL